MILGVDAGGTNFDAVLVDNSGIVDSAKVPAGSLEELFTELLNGDEKIDRTVISTTLVLNEAVQDRLEDCTSILIPGPGLNPKLAFCAEENIIAKGCVDHRGRLTEKVELEEEPSNEVVAVTAKFSTRNPEPENQLKSEGKIVSLGHEAGGRLGFPKRAATTVSNAKSIPVFSGFKNDVEQALNSVGIEAPIYFLKGDGAMISKEKALSAPSYTLKSGPAASALGLTALSDIENSICVDIGGTTTDISIISRGFPDLEEGIEAGELSTFYYGVNSFDLPLGGDTMVDKEGLTEKRIDNSAAFGGKHPTLTDALHVADECDLGDEDASKEAFSQFKNPEDMAIDVIDEFVSRVSKKIKDVGENKKLVCGGVLAPYLTPKISERLDMEFEVPENAGVAGAVGCAVARVSVRTSIHIDSAQGRKTVSSVGPKKMEKIEKGKKFSEEEAKDIARNEAKDAAVNAGGNPDDAEILSFRKFNVVESSRVKGQIIDATAQVKPGIEKNFKK